MAIQYGGFERVPIHYTINLSEVQDALQCARGGIGLEEGGGKGEEE